MANKVNAFDTFSTAGNNAIGLINRVDDATSKFQPNGRRGSIIKSAKGNVFEFPVFISNSIPLDYATATSSLLEQLYAGYLQMAISINPVVSADSIKNGLQFADFKTTTNKYLEYTDTFYQHAICDNVFQEGDVQYEFSLLSYEDNDAKMILEYMDYEPLSEFNHFFQEATYKSGFFTQDQIERFVKICEALELRDYNSDEWNGLSAIITMINRDNPGFRQEMLAKMAENQQRHDAENRNRNASRYDDFTDERGVAHTAAGDNHTERAKARADFDKIMAELNEQGGISYGDHLGNQRKTQKYQADRLEKELNPQSGISYEDNLGNQRLTQQYQRDIAKRNADKANSAYYKANDALQTGLSTVSSAANAVNQTTNAIGNVATIKDQIKQAKLKTQMDEFRASHQADDFRNSTNATNAKMASALKAPQYIDDSKCQKLNTMKPLLMGVTLSMINKDDTVQPINYIIGVKNYNRVVPASILPEVAKYPLKEMDKISRKVKWRAGELKFLNDLVFRIKEKKQTAVDARDPRRKWYRRLYELAHMKGDAPTAAVVQGKSIFGAFIRDKQGKGKLKHGLIPNASIIMSQADVDNIKRETDIDLLKGSVAKNFCGELFLISLVIIDTDAESIKIMLPDMNDDYDVHSLASVQKQLATLDTSGAKTRDMFKLLQ